jgi:molybdopterin-guanine dinucleotide biosynthesis protein A
VTPALCARSKRLLEVFWDQLAAKGAPTAGLRVALETHRPR